MAERIEISTAQMLTKIAMLQLECDERARQNDELLAEVDRLRAQRDELVTVPRENGRAPSLTT